MFTLDENERVFVCPTDTIYGLSARAADIEAVNRIATLKGREQKTGFITLIPDIDALADFDILITPRQSAILAKIWPGAVTVVVPYTGTRWEHLSSHDHTLAFRLPDYTELRTFLRTVGPIVSTSVNRHGEPPAQSITEAQALFGSEVDAYLDGGELKNEPSSIIKLIR